MSDNLIMTERLMKAATCLNEAEMLVKAEGQWENLERLSGWSPAHVTSKLERDLNEQCRLLGMSGEREARLLARVAELERENARLLERAERWGLIERIREARAMWRSVKGAGLLSVEKFSRGRIAGWVRLLQGIPRAADQSEK